MPSRTFISRFRTRGSSGRHSHVTTAGSAVDKALILHTSVTIGYDAPWREVHKLLIAAASGDASHSGGSEAFRAANRPGRLLCLVRNQCVHGPTFDDGDVIYSELHQNIQDKFNDAGVEIMSPHYHAVRDGNTTAIPETYLSPDYVPAGFRFFRSPAKGKGAPDSAATEVPPRTSS